MSRLKKRADGRAVVTKRINGKKEFFYGKTQSEARNKLEEFEEAQKKQVYNSDILYTEWLDAWLDAIVDSIAKSTYQSYKSVVENHLRPDLGYYKLCELNAPLMRKFLKGKKESGLSGRTREYIYVLAKTSLELAVEDDLLAKNPMQGVAAPQVIKKEMVALTKKQAEQLIKYIQNPDIQRLFLVALKTGFRRSELLGLRWRDADFKHNTLSIQQTVLKIGGQTTISPTTKNSKSRRTIAMDVATMEQLKKQKVDIFKKRLQDSLYQDNDLIFPGEHGGPRNPDWVTKMARDYGKALNFPAGFNFHSLRHTHATLLLKAGVPYKKVQVRLGHASFKQTMDTYSHISPEFDFDADAILNKII